VTFAAPAAAALLGVGPVRLEQATSAPMHFSPVLTGAPLILAVQMRPRGAERHPVLHDAATAAPAAVSVAETQLRNC
jgi:hypothetical protein